MDDYTWPLTGLAAVAGVIVVLQALRSGAIHRAWLLSPSPRCRGVGQGFALLLTLLLAAAAFFYNASEFRTLSESRTLKDGAAEQNWEVSACVTAEKLSPLVCRQRLAVARARFDVLGFSFGLGTAAALLSAAFSGTVTAMTIVFRRGKSGEGLVDELIDRRLVRLPLLAIIGWLFSYLVGHAYLGATSSADDATRASTRVMLATIFSASAVALVARRRQAVPVVFAIAGIAAVWFLCFASPRGISNIQLVPALNVVALLILEFGQDRDLPSARADA